MVYQGDPSGALYVIASGRVKVSLTQSDIAALVGATRERVSRALSAFRTSGTIAWNKPAGRWIICKPSVLEKRAQMCARVFRGEASDET